MLNASDKTKMSLRDFMHQLGMDPDFTPMPGGSYVPGNVRANIAYVAIQFPIVKEGKLFPGRLGNNLSTEEGYQAARRCALNVLAQINKYAGFEALEGLNHIDIYYQCVKGWNEAPQVANGASDLFIKALGPKGIHTRSLCGVESLPENFSVGITASFTLSSN